MAASFVAVATSFCPLRMAWIIELVVFFACTAPKFGVTGTDAAAVDHLLGERGDERVGRGEGLFHRATGLPGK